MRYLVSIMCILIMVSISYADDIVISGDYNNINLSNSVESTTKEKEKYNWMVRTFAGGYDLRLPIYPEEKDDYFFSSMSLLYSFNKKENSEWFFGPAFGLIGAKHASAPTFGVMLHYRYTFWDKLYIQPGVGAMYAANSDDLPHLGGNPYGNISFEIGWNFTERFSIGYSQEHISSIFDTRDSGMNVGVITLSVRF